MVAAVRRSSFYYNTLNMYAHQWFKSVYCVVMCTARFIDIIFLSRSLVRDRSSIKIDIDVRDVHVKLYSITKK